MSTFAAQPARKSAPFASKPQQGTPAPVSAPPPHPLAGIGAGGPAKSQGAEEVYKGLYDGPEKQPDGGGKGILKDGKELVDNAIHQVTEAVSNWEGPGASTSDPYTAHGGDPLYQGEPHSLLGSIGQTIGDFRRGAGQEGLSGILDPAGMLDRQRAQRELSNRFQVGDFGAKAASNQVSQEEYERIAHTFSDIRMGRGDLTIDSSGFSPVAGEDREAWEQGIQANIADMMMTQGGRRQIMGLSDNVTRRDDGTARRALWEAGPDWGIGPEVHHQTTIQPFFDEHGAHTGDASALRYDQAETHQVDDTPLDNLDEPWSRDRDTHARGRGTDAIILMNPGVTGRIRSDVVMDHEMEHALNMTQGTLAPKEPFTSDLELSSRNLERQAMGLRRFDTPEGGRFDVSSGGRYPGDPEGCSEEEYRWERVAFGDHFLPRLHHSDPTNEDPSYSSDYPNDAGFKRQWTEYQDSLREPIHDPYTRHYDDSRCYVQDEDWYCFDEDGHSELQEIQPIQEDPDRESSPPPIGAPPLTYQPTRPQPGPRD